jgi:hypothetical protein
MTIQEFKRDFCCKVTIHNQDNVDLIIISEAIRRNDGTVVDHVRTTIYIQTTNSWISDSNSMTSITPWNWTKLIDETKRMQLDYFAQRAPIVDWYPLNREENPDISDIYC